MRKIEAKRREAFLAALKDTGNQTLSAERAKVSRSWVSLHRSGDPEFRRLCDEAIAAAKQSLGAHAKRRPPRGWGFADGEELVVKGSNGRRVQIARARVRQWSPRVEDRFLAALTATCNVKAACAEVGLTPASAYNHRKRWWSFRRRWDEAIETGYAQLECALVMAAGNLFSGEGLPAVSPLREMTVDQAIHLLHMHKHSARGIGDAPGKRWRPPPSLEDPGMREGILRKLEMFARKKGLEFGP